MSDTEQKKRFVEKFYAQEMIHVYDPEFFELKGKYDHLCKVVLEQEDADTFVAGQYLHSYMVQLAKGETN